MGQIGPDHGTISIEKRRESFIIHAGYGYVPKIVEVGTLALRDEFVWKRERYRVTLVSEERVEASREPFGAIETFLPAQHVERPGFEDDAEGPHARWWREAGHPEFALEDLDDLIAALRELRGDAPCPRCDTFACTEHAVAGGRHADV